MARLAKVSPNRMELLKNKRRLKLAERGHKLLKDKYDELVKRFYAFLREHENQREEAEKQIGELYLSFTLLRAQSPRLELSTLMNRVLLEVKLDVETKSLLNTKVPRIEIESRLKRNYAATLVPIALESFLQKLKSTIDLMAELVQFEHTVRVLAAEIEKTRRRVNALEHVFIPQISANIRFISMKMDEIDRENRIRFLRTKELLAAEAEFSI